MDCAGIIGHVARALRAASVDPVSGAALSGRVLAFASNLMIGPPG
jgi:arsenical pump membrane protein